MYLLSERIKIRFETFFSFSRNSKERIKPPRSSGTYSHLQAEQDIKRLVNSILKKKQTNMTLGEERRVPAPPRKVSSWGKPSWPQPSPFYVIKKSPLPLWKAVSIRAVLSRAREHDRHHACQVL